MLNDVNLLTLYNDSVHYDSFIYALNCLNYGLHIAFQMFMLFIALGAIGFSHKQYVTSKAFDSILPVSVGLTLLNAFFGIYFNIYCFLLFSAIIIVLSFINIKRKSLKWISSLVVFFTMLILCIYFTALALVSIKTNLVMSDLGITEYSYVVKDFFKVYQIQQNLIMIDYKVGDTSMQLDNTTMYKRLYTHLYFLNSLATIFWFVVYRKVLVLHGIKIKNIIEKDKEKKS